MEDSFWRGIVVICVVLAAFSLTVGFCAILLLLVAKALGVH
jgi:hypothetical protein